MRKATDGATKIAHVTDAHTTMDGQPTTVLKHRAVEILDDVVDQLIARDAECILFGGDNIDNRGAGERDLIAFEGLVSRLPNWRCVPGNHEASGPKPGRITKAQFQRRFADHGVRPEAPGFSHAIGDVRVIGIDTTLVGAPGGFVPPDGLAYLAAEIEAATETHIVVLGHHLLVPCWTPHRFDTWDQDYLVRNANEVIGLLARQPRVRAYLCGHHHAHRITRVERRGRAGFGFYQVLTGSPVAFPHAARLLTFAPGGLEIETVRPRLAGVLDEGRQAVLLGRKARRFAELGLSSYFLGYLEGTTSDNHVVLPYAKRRTRRAAQPRAANR